MPGMPGIVKDFLRHPGRVRVFLFQETEPLQQWQDTGKGLSPEELEWITAPFEGEKTSQDLETKGRGLHIAKNIIKLMGGQLAVTTKPGSGTEFVLHISLPLAPK